MNVTCPSCATVYRVDPAKIPSGGVRARCAVCPAVFGVYAEVAPPAPAVEAPVSSEPVPPPPAAVPPRPTPEPAVVVPPAPPITARPTMPPVARTPGNRPSIPPQSLSRFGGSGTGHPVPPAAAPRPPVNPFLSRDPGQKARRLARALVSDLVVYNPDKRKEALRAGNLKEQFADEIRKSWDEYVEQVGKDLAESTPHFTDALNEILGDGRKIF